MTSQREGADSGRPPGLLAAAMAGQVAEGSSAPAARCTHSIATLLLPKVDEGLKRAGRPGNSIERMIEVKVSFDTDFDRAMEDTRHRAKILALTPEEKMNVEDPLEMERVPLRHCRSSGQRAAGSSPQTRRSNWRRSDPISSSASPTSSSTLRAPTSPASETLRRAGAAVAACQAGDDPNVTLSALSGHQADRAPGTISARSRLPRRGPTGSSRKRAMSWSWRRRSSPSRGTLIDIATAQPSEGAISLAAEVDKDPRFVEVVLPKQIGGPLSPGPA